MTNPALVLAMGECRVDKERDRHGNEEQRVQLGKIMDSLFQRAVIGDDEFDVWILSESEIYQVMSTR